MAATNRSIDYDALLTMTADNYYKAGVIHDGVMNSNPTFKKFNENGETITGIMRSKLSRQEKLKQEFPPHFYRLLQE